MEAAAALRVAPALVEDDFTVIGKYVRLYGDAMMLRDWKFEIMHDPVRDGQIARIVVGDYRSFAQLSVCSDFRQLADDVQRYALVHELVHPHLVEMDFSMRGLQDELGLRLFRAVYGNFERAMERTVDALAHVIAPNLPLIEWV